MVINSSIDLSPLVDNQKVINDNIGLINQNLAVIVENQAKINDNLKILEENILSSQKVHDQILKQSMHVILEDNILIMDYLEKNCSGRNYD
jgi:hypothetical protein